MSLEQIRELLPELKKSELIELGSYVMDEYIQRGISKEVWDSKKHLWDSPLRSERHKQFLSK